jgi:hypothetical protein
MTPTAAAAATGVHSAAAPALPVSRVAASAWATRPQGVAVEAVMRGPRRRADADGMRVGGIARWEVADQNLRARAGGLPRRIEQRLRLTPREIHRRIVGRVRRAATSEEPRNSNCPESENDGRPIVKVHGAGRCARGVPDASAHSQRDRRKTYKAPGRSTLSSRRPSARLCGRFTTAEVRASFSSRPAPMRSRAMNICRTTVLLALDVERCAGLPWRRTAAGIN